VLAGDFRRAAARAQVIFELVELLDQVPHVSGAGFGGVCQSVFVGGHLNTIVPPSSRDVGRGGRNSRDANRLFYCIPIETVADSYCFSIGASVDGQGGGLAWEQATAILARFLAPKEQSS
jgi:hypothetical protein